MAIPKLTGNMLRAARSLCGISRDQLATRSGLSRDVLRPWEISSEGIVPAATYSHLCRALDVLEGEVARFSGDGISALSGDSPDYLKEAVPPSINSNDSKGFTSRCSGPSRRPIPREASAGAPICEGLTMVRR